MVQISSAKPSDAPAIQYLLRETWLDTYGDHLSQATLDEVYKNWQSIEFLTKQIENSEMYFPVAKDSETLLGIATARKPENTIVIFRLYVLPMAQRKGVGSLLLENVVNHFPEAKAVQLHVEAMNTVGRNFYKKQGFQELKREQEQVVNETIEQILMEKKV